MKWILIACLLVINLSSGFVEEARAQKAPARNVLVDFRKDTPLNSAVTTAATQRRVLSKVFPRYLTDENNCNRQFDPAGEDYLVAARKAGQIVPSIVDSAKGSFTGKAKTEIAYVISVSECGASHADNYGSKRIAIFDGDRLVADIDADFKSNIVRKTDLDANGVEELLMVTGDMAQGTLIEIGALLSFENSKLQVLQDLGTVTEDSCNSELPGSSSKAAVISIAPGARQGFPRLNIDIYEASCRKLKRWRFVSSGKME